MDPGEGILSTTDTATELSTDATNGSLSPGAGTTLLVADDSPSVQRKLTEYFTGTGYRVVAANDGAAALACATATLPDLILLEARLPGTDGLHVCRSLRAAAATASIPIIFMSSATETSERVACLKAGGVDYMSKPLELEELAARINVHLAIVRRHKRLAQRDIRRERLLEVIAHDLRSPVAAFVSAFHDLASLDRDDPLFGQIIDALGDRADRLNGLLDSLLEWGLAQIDVETSAIGPLLAIVTEVTGHLAAAANAKRIAIDLEVSDELYVCRCGPTLHTVLSNLMSNALKFTPSGGRVGVRAAREDGQLRVEVWDEGVGMCDSDLESIFIRNKRIRRTGTNGERGSGLGLFLSRDLVDWVGGTLEARSELGKGSTFTVLVPGECNPE